MMPSLWGQMDILEGLIAMPVHSKVGLPERIQKLLEDRHLHATAVETIDKLLGGIGAVLGVGAKRGPGRPKSTASPVVGVKKRKRRRRTFAVSGEQSILEFIKSNKNPTSQEIEKHWKGEGRSFVAANLLSKLVKEKTLKRTPLGKGIRGSRYSLS
jgi:hypothetical protein